MQDVHTRLTAWSINAIDCSGPATASPLSEKKSDRAAQKWQVASHLPANSGYVCLQLLSWQKCVSQPYSPLAICIEQKFGCPDSMAHASMQQL
jgi:hypothetical protein